MTAAISVRRRNLGCCLSSPGRTQLSTSILTPSIATAPQRKETEAMAFGTLTANRSPQRPQIGYP